MTQPPDEPWQYGQRQVPPQFEHRGTPHQPGPHPYEPPAGQQYPPPRPGQRQHSAPTRKSWPRRDPFSAAALTALGALFVAAGIADATGHGPKTAAVPAVTVTATASVKVAVSATAASSTGSTAANAGAGEQFGVGRDCCRALRRSEEDRRPCRRLLQPASRLRGHLRPVSLARLAVDGSGTRRGWIWDVTEKKCLTSVQLCLVIASLNCIPQW